MSQGLSALWVIDAAIDTAFDVPAVRTFAKLVLLYAPRALTETGESSGTPVDIVRRLVNVTEGMPESAPADRDRERKICDLLVAADQQRVFDQLVGLGYLTRQVKPGLGSVYERTFRYHPGVEFTAP